MKKFLGIALALTLSVLIFKPLNASAITSQSNKSEKEVVTIFLQSLINSDIDTAVSLSRDLTLNYEEQKNNLIDMLNNPNNQILSFEVTENPIITDNIYLDAVVKYKNESVDQIRFALEKNDNGYQIIKPYTTVTNIEKGFIIETINPRAQLTTFNFNNTYDYNYSSIFSSTSSYVQVNFQADGPNTFRVVKTSIFTSDEDITWASSQNGTGGTAKLITLNCIPDKSLTNVKLRVARNGNKCIAFGEVYSY